MSKSVLRFADINFKVDATRKITHGLITNTGRLLSLVAFQLIQRQVKLTLLEESFRGG